MRANCGKAKIGIGPSGPLITTSSIKCNGADCDSLVDQISV